MFGRRTLAVRGRGINSTIPYTVDADGTFTAQAPGFTGKRVLTAKGERGDANLVEPGHSGGRRISAMRIGLG